MRKLAPLFLLLVVACGKRGDPRPPVPIIPKATSDLVVTQRGTNLVLTWSYPALTTAGQSLHEIRRVVVYRYTEPLPVPQAGRDQNAIMPGDVDPTVPQPIAQFAHIPAIGPVPFGRLKERVDSIEGANVAGATAGARLVYQDAPAFHTVDGRPVRFTYGIVTESVTAKSDLSNLATIVPVDVPVPPAGLTATANAKGIALSWTAPDKSVTGAAKPFLTGYNVYRLAPTATLDESSTPVNAAPIAATTYLDTPTYGPYVYRVTAVAAAGPPRIESDPSAPATANFKDLVPPPVPANLNALLEPRAVRLIWDPVDEPELAGYKVYRTEGVGHDENIREAGTILLIGTNPTTTTFTDSNPQLGIAYKYGVSAMDKHGNESAPVWTGWVVVPKTP